ncbi:MAG: caspase family protein [Candidatus Cloacimonetes bacterium]|nr:caspase family protein [Candidatus Cloacimonadota bacterium]
MKKLIPFVILLCIATTVEAYTIEETLSQIESLKQEIEQNEIIVVEKLKDLKQNNPLFADQDFFESDIEYIARMSKAMPQINQLRKQNLGDLWQKMNILRGQLFETKNITVILDSKNYDPNTEEWKVAVDHLDYQKEHFEVILKIAKTDASALFKNKDKLQKTGILAVDVGDKIGLAKLRLNDPVSGFEFEYEFQPMRSFKHGRYVKSVAFSPDGKFLATGWNDGNARIFNLETGNEVRSFKHGNYVYSVAFSTDGKFLATGCNDDNARIFNLETGNEVRSFKHGNSVYSVAFSPDGKFLATGSNDNNARILNLETGNEVRSFKHGRSVAFSPDGKFLATGSYDNNARIFNLETGNEVRSFKHGNDVYSVAFSSDGKYLAVGCNDEFAYLYRTLFQVEEEVLAQKTITRPPSLSAKISFEEPSGNQYLDALEKGNFIIKIINTGKGPGKGITVKIHPERLDNLNYNKTYIEEITPGEDVSVKIPIEAYIGLQDDDHTFRFDFEEINGFPPAPVEIQISTKSYNKPELFIADVGIEDGNSNGKIESGEMVNLTVRFANKGKGMSSGTYAKFYTDDNVFLTDTFPKTVKLGEIDYTDYVDVPIEFFVNDNTKEEIPLYVDITESTGLATVDKLRIPIKKSDKTRKIQKTIIAGIDKKYGDLDFGEELSIDIENNIPQNTKTNENILAVIFGIENYKNVSNVTFAHRDARFIKEYFNKTLGIEESNIYYKVNEDVGKAEFDKVFSKGGWLDKRVKDGKTEIYFYYAGHGSPDIKQNKAYLIPYDGDPNYASQTGYEIEKIYINLANLKAKNVTVFLDACFSGANRENEMLLADARPITIEVDSPIAYGITVFSAASSKEISSAWADMKHGLFSYFLMKGMQGNADDNSDGDLTIKELGDYIQINVSEQAGFLDREQTPSVISDNYNRVLINF